MRGIRRIPAAAVVAAVSVVLLAGCTGDEAARAGSPTAPAYLQVTPHADAPSPSPVPSPSATPEAAPPPQASPATPSEPVQAATPLQVQPVQGTPGEPYDPRQVYDAVVVELNKLLVNPDPDQLELTVSRECDCYQEFYAGFQELLNRQERYLELGVPEITYYRVVRQTDDSFTVYLADRSDPGPIVHALTGEVLRDPPLSATEAKELTLGLDEQGWRITQLRYLVDEQGQNLGDRARDLSP